jgi:putative protease
MDLRHSSAQHGFEPMRAQQGEAAAQGRARTPELLAPAGSEAALRAALSAGADAVYMGMERWGARAFAANFDARALLAAIDRVHLHGARAYLTVNTLLKDGEVRSALEALADPYRAGVDAVLATDLGFAALVRQRYPELALHASTQLNTHSSAQLAALADLGFSRAVLARELSLDEISALETHGVELEVFVHGALCYGYSGLCLFSSMVGGRSGNRGRCAQACRMRYRLGIDEAGAAMGPRGDPRERSGESTIGSPLADGRLLSAADLAAIGELPSLLAAGVRALKIEGRMKDAAYVATAVGVYREALDEALVHPDSYSVQPEWLERLEQSFSRGFTAGHLRGRHDEVRSGGRGGHRGVQVGRVERVDEADSIVVIRLSQPVQAGDRVCLYTKRGQTAPVRLQAGARGTLTLHIDEPVAPKDRLFRLRSAAVDERARDATTGRRVTRPLPLVATFRGAAGQMAHLTLCLPASGVAPVTVCSSRSLEPARSTALDETRVRTALSALGGTPYELRELAFDLPAGLFLPVAELRDLRRRAVAAIDQARLRLLRRSPVARDDAGAVDDWAPDRSALPPRGRSGGRRPAATGRMQPRRGGSSPAVVVRRRPGAGGLSAPGLGGVCLDLDAGVEPTLLAGEIAEHHADGLHVLCRPPAILFDSDQAWWRAIAELPWDAVYARHAAHVRSTAPIVLEYPLQGLGSGNADALSAAGLGAVIGVVASPELRLSEICDLRAALDLLRPPPRLEILAFGRQEVLLTRDTLGRSEGFVMTASPEQHVRLLLEDVKGFRFPVAVSARGSSIANARVTNLTSHLDALGDAGVEVFLVEEAAMNEEEHAAFTAGGLEALAPLAERERSTTGHLFRGVE